MRENLKDLTKQYDISENDLKALQSVGQVIISSGSTGLYSSVAERPVIDRKVGGLIHG